MKKLIGIYTITIDAEADISAFENFVKSEVFNTVNVGRQTRGGIVTAQYLVKEEWLSDEKTYQWIVHWENQGGSPFGSTNAPNDPVNLLRAFGATTQFTRYIVLND